MAIEGVTNNGTISDIADDAGAKVKKAARTTREKASDVIVEVKDEVSVLAEKAGAGAKTAASSGKDMAADAVHGLADAARQMAGKLGDGNEGSANAKAADYARKAADSMDRFSTRLKEKDVDAIAADARDAVRKNPAIAVGAAALIGFALARLLKGGNSGADA